MGLFVELITTFPTVVFTVPLVCCLVWFLLGLVVSGFDVGEGDVDIDLDGDGDIAGLEHLASALHVGALGLPLVLLLLSLGGWSVSLVVSLVMNKAGWTGALAALAALALGLVGSVWFVWKVGGWLGGVLATQLGATRQDAIGSVCKVRTLEVTETFGDAEVTSGPMRSSIVRVRAPKGRFRRGDVALVVEHDAGTDAYWIAEIEEQYRPH